MGFWHQWRVKKEIDDAQWSTICNEAQRLFDAFPSVIAQGMYKPGYKPSVLGRLSQYLWRKRYAVPAEAGYPDGRVARLSEIIILPNPKDSEDTGSDPFPLSRHVHVSCCKTQAQPYDRLVGAIFLVCETHAPGCLTIDSSDAELYLWQAYKKWSTEVLGYETFIPGGAPGYRKGAAARSILAKGTLGPSWSDTTSPGF
jgi:hypothetical protein